MAVRKQTIKQQLDQIRRAFKQRDDATGMLYNTRAQLRRKMKKVTLWGMFVSDENTFLIRPHIFEAKEGRNAVEWEQWFAEHYTTVQGEDNRTPILTNILDGMENRTGKQWRLYRVIGWAADDNSRVIRAKTRKKRNKTKSKRQ